MKRSLSQEDVLKILRRELPYLRTRYGVERMVPYGSFAKGTCTAKSDVDIIVELSKPLGLEFVELADYLEKALGRKVHLVTFSSMLDASNTYCYSSVMQDIERTLIDVC